LAHNPAEQGQNDVMGIIVDSNLQTIIHWGQIYMVFCCYQPPPPFQLPSNLNTLNFAMSHQATSNSSEGAGCLKTIIASTKKRKLASYISRQLLVVRLPHVDTYGGCLQHYVAALDIHSR
jgi:hypothetical protein